MTMRFMHVVIAILTVILFFIRQRCVAAGVCPAKRRALEESRCSSGDSSFTTLPLPSAADCVVCSRAACFYEQCGQPKYKRDPDISVDNESIGQHPLD